MILNYIYSFFLQSIDNPGLKEADAWPAWPQDTYGFEKLYAEEMAMIYGRDFNITTRMARFHNIYGPFGTWCGGREKAPAAFCRFVFIFICTFIILCFVHAFDRKAAACTNSDVVDIWGDGRQTRSFCYIDDCVEGIIRIMFSDYDKPLNLGSDEMVDMNNLLGLALSFSGKHPKIKHIAGPEGVRGRNSNNVLIQQVLGWCPQTPLKVGLRKTYDWIAKQIQKARDEGSNEDFLVSKVVKQDASVLDNIAGLLGSDDSNRNRSDVKVDQ